MGGATSVDGQASTRAVSHTDMTRIIKVTVKQKNAKNIGSSPEHRGNTLKHESLHSIKIRIKPILSRLRISHTNLTDSYLMEGGTNPLVCNRCNVHIPVNHIGRMPKSFVYI